MPPEITGWIPQAGATGLLLTAVWLVLSGKIIPKTIHDEARKDRDAYRIAAETALAASKENADAVRHLTRAVEQLTVTTTQTLELVRALVPTERMRS